MNFTKKERKYLNETLSSINSVSRRRVKKSLNKEDARRLLLNLKEIRLLVEF